MYKTLNVDFRSLLTMSSGLVLSLTMPASCIKLNANVTFEIFSSKACKKIKKPNLYLKNIQV